MGIALRTTIANTLKDAGVPPSPERPTSWHTFLKSHADVITATDFFTVDVWTARGLVTHYVLFVIHHATRIVEIAGITTNPNAEFMAQVARNVTDPVDGFLRRMRYLILDRDTKFTEQVKRILKDAGVKLVTKDQAPDMNAIAERWVLSAKSECLNRMILFGERHLRRALKEYVDHHYRFERPHQGLGNELIAPPPGDPPSGGEVVADERLGGLLRSYRYAA